MPTYSIQGPDGKTYSIDGPAGATREQVIQKIKAKQNRLPAFPTQPQEKAGFFDSIGSGIDISQKAFGSAAEGIGSVLGAESLEKYGADVAARNEAELGQQKRRTTFKDVQEAKGVFDTAGKLGSFGAGALGESLPQMGVNIGGYKAGAKLGARLGSVAGIPGAVVGGIAGGLAGAIPFFYGDNREAQKESIEQGLIQNMDEGAAFLGAIPQAALDLVADRFLFGLTKKGFDVNLNEVLQQGGMFTRGAKNIVAGAAVEMPTEIGQEIISRYQSGQAIDSPEAIEAYIEVGAAAGLVGGGIRGASGVLRGDLSTQKEKDDAIIKAQESAIKPEEGIEEEKPVDFSKVNNYEEDVEAARQKLDEDAYENERQEKLRSSEGIDSDKLTQTSLQKAKNEIFNKAGKDDFAISDEEAAEYIKTGKHPFIKEEYIETPTRTGEEDVSDADLEPLIKTIEDKIKTLTLNDPIRKRLEERLPALYAERNLRTKTLLDKKTTAAAGTETPTPTGQSAVGDTIELYDENGDLYTSTVVKVSEAGSRIVLDKNKKEILIDTVGAQVINPKADNYVLQGKGSKFREATNNKININELTLDELKAASKVQQEMYKSVPNEGMGAMALQDLIAIKNRVDILTKQQAATPKTSAATPTPTPELERLQRITNPDVTIEGFQARSKKLGSDYAAIEELGTREKALLHLAGDMNTSEKLKDARTEEEKTEDKAKAKPKSQNVMMERANDLAENQNKLKNLDRKLKPTVTIVKDKEGKVVKDKDGKPKTITTYPNFGSRISPIYKKSGGKKGYEFYKSLSPEEKTFVRNKIVELKGLELRAERIEKFEDRTKEENKTAQPVETIETIEAADEVINTFTTASGSTYTQYGDTSTIRNRAERGDKEGSGEQERSARTVFMTSSDALTFSGIFQGGKLGTYQLVPDNKNNTVRLVFVENYGPKKIGDNATDPVPFLTEPKVGLIPVELAQVEEGSESGVNDNPRNIHFGNEITEVTDEYADTEPSSTLDAVSAEFDKKKGRETDNIINIFKNKNLDDDGYPIEDDERAKNYKAAVVNRKKQEAEFKKQKEKSPFTFKGLAKPDPLEIQELSTYRDELLAVSPELASDSVTMDKFLEKKLIDLRETKLTNKINELTNSAKDSEFSIPLIAPEQPSTVALATYAIKSKFSNSDISQLVSITETPEAAGLNINPAASGAVEGGKVYLFTNNIQEGNELGVFMHEVGQHLGMKNFIGGSNYAYLVNRVKAFAGANDNSRGAQIAIAAKTRLENANKFTELTPSKLDDELLAYFIEEAVYKGVDPLGVSKQSSAFGDFFKRLINAVKNALRKLGFSIRNTTAPINEQDIVDLAYGAADMELRKSSEKNGEAALENLFDDASKVNTLSATLNSLNALTGNEVGYSPAERIFKGNLSNFGSSIRSFLYSTLSFYQLSDEVRRIGKEGTELSRKSNELADSIRALEYIAAKRRRITDDYRRDFTTALIAAERNRDEALQNLPKEKQAELLKEFYDIAHSSSIQQLDLRDYFKDKDKRSPNVVLSSLYKRFSELPPGLRNAYVILSNQYEIAGLALLNAQKKIIGDSPTASEQNLLAMLEKRIVPYFPLSREGEYWVDVELPSEFINPENNKVETKKETFTFAFTSKAEAENAQRSYESTNDTIIRPVYVRSASDNLQDGGYAAYNKLLREVKSIKGKNPAEKAANNQLLDLIQKQMMDSFPSESLMNQYKKRGNIPGYEPDVFKNFANMAFKMSNELTQIDTLKELNDAVDAVTVSDTKIDVRLNDAVKTVTKRADFLRNPTPNRFAGMAAYTGYNAYLAGNVSSAVVNLTQLPVVTFPKLYSEFGLAKATKMLVSTSKIYGKNLADSDKGRDDNTALTVPGLDWSLADVTIFTKEALANDSGLQDLYNVAKDRGAIRRTTSQELQDARNNDGIFKLGGDLQRIELAASWAFQNSERANREIGIYAAYKLGIEKGYSQEEAVRRAVDITEEASGTALAELGPQIFQDNWGKVFGTFKRFAFSQVYLLYKLHRQALGYLFPSTYKPDNMLPIDPATGKPIDARKLAVKQLAGINIMAGVFSGVQGTPLGGIGWVFYTLGNATLEVLGVKDEDDDRLTYNQFLKQTMGEIAYRGPLSYYTNLAFSNRVGLNPSALIFRYDPRKAEELGFYYPFVALAGPTFSYAEGVVEGAFKYFDPARKEPFFDAMQMALPAALKNPLKAARLLTEGAVNKKGVPILDDPSSLDAFGQFWGFAPADISNKWEDIGFVYELDNAILDKRRQLKDLRYWAIDSGDSKEIDEVEAMILKFNLRDRVIKTGKTLSNKDLNNSYKSKQKYIYESLFGISIDRGVAQTLYDEVTADE
tara:strand:- start:40 stop:7092 length:7053 start_codon:yes stop_codon:yes gene_type:complete